MALCSPIEFAYIISMELFSLKTHLKLPLQLAASVCRELADVLREICDGDEGSADRGSVVHSMVQELILVLEAY